MNHNELTAFINNPSNNLSKENSIDQLKIKVVYKPNDFIIQRELISKEKFDSDMIDSLREKFGDYYYFNCSMTIDDADLINGSAGNRNYFSELSEKLNFGLVDCIRIISGSDTSVIDDYALPRLYEASKATDFMIVIKKTKITEDNFRIEFNIPELNIVNSSLMFSKNIIEKVPRLKFNNSI